MVSLYVIPVLFLIILGTALFKDIKAYDAFIEGAREGIGTIVKIIPSLVGMITAIGVFRSSGALDIVMAALAPLAQLLGIPGEVMPLVLLRPVSGSASLALVSDIIGTYGPDSFIGRVASTMMGSTETIFYTITIYYGSIGIKNIRYTLAAALVADGVSVMASAFVCAYVFRG